MPCNLYCDRLKIMPTSLDCYASDQFKPRRTKQLLIKDMDKIEFTGYLSTIDLTMFLLTTDTRPAYAARLAKNRSE